MAMEIHYAEDTALDPDEFLDLARRVWPRDYDREHVREALRRTINIVARSDGRIVGCARILSDGYFFGTIPEILVDPAVQRQGIGRALMEMVRQRSPTSLFFGAQPGNEAFFEKLGCERGMTSFVLRKPAEGTRRA